MVSLVLVREGAASTKSCAAAPSVFCDMDLEVACAVILPGPMVRVFVALWPVPFGMGWCFPTRGVCPWCARLLQATGLVVFPRRRQGRPLADLALLVEFLAVLLGLPFFAAFSELRGFAACSFRHSPQEVSHPGG